jgi:ubiquinone/menaquinone biosynthesis C-methylase UbiE
VVLDIACGQGAYALAMARIGYEMTGVDRSAQMLGLAAGHFCDAGARVCLVRADMRDLPFESGFDLVTCWYDSLNYLLELADLERAFAGACRALRPGGLFVFDMNTIYTLAVSWQRATQYIQQDTDDLFEVHINRYDYERQIAIMRIVGFCREDGRWVRIEEVHRERGYPLTAIEACLDAAGLEVLGCWGNLDEMTPPGPETKRVWWVTRRPAA